MEAERVRGNHAGIGKGGSLERVAMPGDRIRTCRCPARVVGRRRPVERSVIDVGHVDSLQRESTLGLERIAIARVSVVCVGREPARAVGDRQNITRVGQRGETLHVHPLSHSGAVPLGFAPRPRQYDISARGYLSAVYLIFIPPAAQPPSLQTECRVGGIEQLDIFRLGQSCRADGVGHDLGDDYVAIICHRAASRRAVIIIAFAAVIPRAVIVAFPSVIIISPSSVVVRAVRLVSTAVGRDGDVGHPRPLHPRETQGKDFSAVAMRAQDGVVEYLPAIDRHRPLIAGRQSDVDGHPPAVVTGERSDVVCVPAAVDAACRDETAAPVARQGEVLARVEVTDAAGEGKYVNRRHAAVGHVALHRPPASGLGRPDGIDCGFAVGQTSDAPVIDVK